MDASVGLQNSNRQSTAKLVMDIELISSFGRLFHSCPIEIVREIFELTARDSSASACSLALVSKDVREWVVPYLYQTIVITKPSHIESIISNSRSLPGSSRFLAQHTQNLAFAWAEENKVSIWDDDVMQGIVWLLRACRGIRTLLIDFQVYALQLIGLMAALPLLERIHCLDSSPPLPKALATRISHLNTRVHSVSELQSHLLSAWGFPLCFPPLLTHLGYHVVVFDRDDCKAVLDIASKILQTGSISKLVITFAHSGRGWSLLSGQRFATDPRLCLLLSGTLRKDVLRDWEMEARGGCGIWNRESLENI
ncbi:hypothetical protein K439DRAFT_1520173 [Ramaria rubella]|nr:hypothetical protein K439DRAFT_1520173 [Ramaria rubella]